MTRRGSAAVKSRPADSPGVAAVRPADGPGGAAVRPADGPGGAAVARPQQGRSVSLWTVLAVLAVMVAAYLYPSLTAEPPLPRLEDGWWRRAPRPEHEDTAVHPFLVTATPGLMDDIRSRLEKAEGRLTPPLEGANFTYGFNTDYLREVMLHWRTKYDWKRRLKGLNEFPQFRTNIEGLDIHFIHIKPEVPSERHVVQPLLLLHGWPSSVVEFRRLLPLLTRPRPGHTVVFEVICPSLPGYGFSAAAERPGLGVLQVAQIMQKLMARLGFSGYFVQGGDWGSLIATAMGTLYPEVVAGIHLNFPVSLTWRSAVKHVLGALAPGWTAPEFFRARLYPLGEFATTLLRETGYFHLQATRPDTLGVALSDSPAGLAAYILEKFAVWTDPANLHRPDGGLTTEFQLDDLLDNVMVYWLSGSVTSSVRLYAEAMGRRAELARLSAVPCRVPAGLLFAPHELAAQPPALLAASYPDVVSQRRLDSGGHFLALQRPHQLAEHVFVTVTAVYRRREEQQRREAAQETTEHQQNK